ncbi:OmpA family protein [Uliginosibacterium sp. 31-16]|uniref:OmpA family protein n=1 Tax=Uliginosibacterium sp. 31-16 TaxID=3068315 RepID=UPI00273EF903|nr:OmpA family protein [Uliginosibacterium sp. 31-16]MDP5240036.1 OmpA family protein [Uliginosibacterium sp. 31-16]
MNNQRPPRAECPSACKPVILLFGLLFGLLLILFTGCARQSIILVPDANGHVGKAEVSTTAGSQTLEKPGDMTRTSGSSKPPSAITTASPEYIASTFREVLAIEPPPAQTFTLMFESGTKLTADSQKIIPDIVSASQRPIAISVSISGHTDATGSDKLNDALSLDRARQIKSLLLQSGVKPELISVSSHGKGNPLIPTPDGVAEPRNRRVVVVVH